MILNEAIKVLKRRAECEREAVQKNHKLLSAIETVLEVLGPKIGDKVLVPQFEASGILVEIHYINDQKWATVWANVKGEFTHYSVFYTDLVLDSHNDID